MILQGLLIHIAVTAANTSSLDLDTLHAISVITFEATVDVLIICLHVSDILA